VQPAALSDGWNTEPFVLTESANGALYGRGASDDKGPVLGWFWAIEAYAAAKLPLPVNIKVNDVANISNSS
jgi:acetylornithine deacetylase/succinyl-diaminopimelate desuccinylase-like protein